MYFEDVTTGAQFESPWRAVTQGDIDTFAGLTGDRNPVHMDEKYAATTPFGRRIAHGMLTLSLALGLWSGAGYTKESLVALIGLDSVKFRSPVFPGDSLKLRSTVVETRDSRSKPDSGIVVYDDLVVNNNQSIVVEFRRTVLLKKRPQMP